MRIAMALLAASLVFGSAACKKKEKTAASDMGSGSAITDTGSGSAGSGSAMAGSGAGSDMAGSGSAMAGSGAGSDMAGSGSGDAQGMAKAAGNCPSTVAKSTTKAEVKGKAILLTITADDKDAVEAIQRRTGELVAVKKGGGSGTGTGHDARGTHKGKVGLCPVHVPEGATIEAKKIAKGMQITITPKDKLDELKAEIDGRVTKAADWVKANVKEGDQGTSGGVGGGKGEHGSNHSGEGDSKGKERKGGDGKGGGEGKGGGGGAGTGGGSQTGSAAGSATK